MGGPAASWLGHLHRRQDPNATLLPSPLPSRLAFPKTPSKPTKVGEEEGGRPERKVITVVTRTLTVAIIVFVSGGVQTWEQLSRRMGALACGGGVQTWAFVWTGELHHHHLH